MNDTLVKEGEPQAAPNVTLASRGPLLSLGIPDSAGTLHKDIAVREWKGKQMRELAKLREESEQLNVAEHVTLVLATLCSQLGPHDFGKMKAKERKLAIAQMFVGDVFHAYLWARYQALGPQLFVRLTCPKCRAEFEFEGDLSTLDLTTADSIEEARWEYELQDPIEIRGGQVDRLLMGPARWYHAEAAQSRGAEDLEGGKLAMVAGTIQGVEGRPDLPLTEGEIDELSGRDIEGIIGALDGHYIGPDMSIETRCERPACRQRIVQAINWSYQDFFGASSRSRDSKKSSIYSSPSRTSHEAV